MKFSLFSFILLCVQAVYAQNYISTSSLLTCMDNSQFTASHFVVTFFPENSTVIFDVTAISGINANVTASVSLIAYGLNIINEEVKFCDIYKTICPLRTGRMDMDSLYNLSSSITRRIPGVAYTIPDLDAKVRVVFYDSDSPNKTPLACVEAILTNGKTVQTKYAAWPIAAIAGLGVITSGVVSVIGHSNTAAHIASNSMSLFIYFQSLALTAMMAVAKVPPIAAAWAQNFQWSLGIVKVAFVQKLANWYVQSTGGSGTNIIKSPYLSISVQKIKRSVDILSQIYNNQRKNNQLTIFDSSPAYTFDKRASLSLDSDGFGYDDKLNSTLYTINEKDSSLQSKILVLRGIQRVSYLAGIEITNLFMTSMFFLLFFAFVMVVCLTLFKAIIEILIRSKMMKEGKFNEYRQQWGHIVKGALYRLILLALPQVSVLCIWQLTVRDSAGTIVVAIFLLVVSLALLSQAALRVFMMGRRSVRQFKNPAYLLFGDGAFLNKFGFIYVQYRADCYYFILVSLVYIFTKALFIAALQSHGKVQSVIVFAIELFHCIAVCYIRPFMDKRTNAFNISIAVVNTINALFFMFFSYIFRQPHVVASVMAVVYFVLNAAFALFLLIFTIVTCVLALIYKNPDTRYQPMKDDRVSFLPRFDNPKQGVPSGANADDMELMALGATAMKGHEHSGNNNIFDEDGSLYEEDSAFNRFNNSGSAIDKKPSNSNSNSREDSEAESKRDSYYLENIEPTQPTSTIVGNPNNALSSFGGNVGGYAQNRVPHGYNQTPPYGSNSGFHQRTEYP